MKMKEESFLPGLPRHRRMASGEINLMLMYAKSALDNLTADVLKRLKKEIEDAND
jgi:hypothetical protein